MIGVFALYQRSRHARAPREHELIEQFTQIASVAIERAQSDASLKQSEARKAAILDSALDCIVTIDHEGRITEFNPAAERTFGYRRDEVHGRAAGRCHHSAVAARAAPAGAGALSGDGRGAGARQAHRDDGDARRRRASSRSSSTITRIALDGPPSFTGYLRDITERKQDGGGAAAQRGLPGRSAEVEPDGQFYLERGHGRSTSGRTRHSAFSSMTGRRRLRCKQFCNAFIREDIPAGARR